MKQNKFAHLIGEKIQEYRSLAALTQEELSIQVGVSKTYISLIENGKKNPSRKLIYRIAKQLNIEVQKLTLEPVIEGVKKSTNLSDETKKKVLSLLRSIANEF